MRIEHNPADLPKDEDLRDFLDDLVGMSLAAIGGLQHCDNLLAMRGATERDRELAMSSAAGFIADLEEVKEQFESINEKW